MSQRVEPGLSSARTALRDQEDPYRVPLAMFEKFEIRPATVRESQPRGNQQRSENLHDTCVAQAPTNGSDSWRVPTVSLKGLRSAGHDVSVGRRRLSQGFGVGGDFAVQQLLV